MSLLGRSTFGNRSSLEINTSNDRPIPSPPSDSVSQLRWSPTADFLAVPSWDKSVRIYEVNRACESQGRAMYEHQAPVLTVDWFSDGSKVLSGGCDNAVRAYDLQSGQTIQIGSHDQAVKGVCCVDVGQPMVASCSWDRTLKYWDLRQQQPIATVQLPERAYTMATARKLLVVGCAERHVCIINLDKPGEIHKTVQSTLKMQTRVVACHTDGLTYAIGSIEGRCGIQYLDDARASQCFSFRCQRHPQTGSKPSDFIYALNDISLHPTYGTVTTAGSDGTFHVWDKENRHRLGLTKNLGGGAITATAFNRDGMLYAYAMGYDWSKGYQFNTPDYPSYVKIHAVQDSEVKPRTSTRKK